MNTINTMITSKQNSFVKYLRELRSKSNRDREKRYLLEGPKSLAEAAAAGVFPEKIIFTERGGKLAAVDQVLANSVEAVSVSDAVMDYLSETETSPGVMGLFRMPEINLDTLEILPSSLLVILDGVQDPGNVGTIIRTADAFGAGAVILTKGCADVYNSKVLRSTMGSVFHLPVIRETSPEELTAFFREQGIFTAVTTLDDSAESLVGVSLDRRPLALVLGSEAKGVSSELIRAADVKVKITTPGKAESLNVAVAAGILLFVAGKIEFSFITSNL